MKNYLEYKGYTGTVEYSAEDNCLFGKVLGIRSLILDLFGNPFGYLTSLAFFRAKALQKCDFNKEVVQKLKFPNNSIIYEGQSVKELKKGFEYMINGYLEDCKAEGREPEKPYKGSLNVRIGSDTHRLLAIQAQTKDMPINAYIKEILDNHIKVSSKKTFELT